MPISIAELHAANVIRDLEEEQEGDLRQILKMARMSVRMNLLNTSGIEVSSATSETRGNTLGIGGYVTGKLSDEITPEEEIEEIVGERKVAKKAVKPKVKKKTWE